MQNTSAVSMLSPATTGTSSQISSSKNAQEQQTQFLRLLVAQLQGQNPLDPKDGSEFVAQLAQFSSLEELINIRTTLDDMAKSATATTNSSNPVKGA